MSGYHLWAELDILTAADLNSYLATQAVPRFATTAARDSAITGPVAGQMCFCTDINGPMMYNGSTWNALPLGIMADPTVSSSLFSTSGTATETRDTVLGNYVFTGVAGRRYRATWRGPMYGQNANDQLILNVRDGGASTPTNTSTVVANGRFCTAVSGSPGQATVVAMGTFTGAGVHTLAAFTQNVGANNLFVTTSSERQLYAEDIGAA